MFCPHMYALYFVLFSYAYLVLCSILMCVPCILCCLAAFSRDLLYSEKVYKEQGECSRTRFFAILINYIPTSFLVVHLVDEDSSHYLFKKAIIYSDRAWNSLSPCIFIYFLAFIDWKIIWVTLNWQVLKIGTFLLFSKYTRWVKMIAACRISHISQLKKMIKFWIFFKKMHSRTLYKNCLKRFLLTYSNGFIHIQKWTTCMIQQCLGE